jgi:hypothetical protein
MGDFSYLVKLAKFFMQVRGGVVPMYIEIYNDG